MTGISEPGASRDGYGDALLDLASDDRVVVLEADLGKSTKSATLGLNIRTGHSA